MDIDETLQDELCELWDMSMNSVNLKTISVNYLTEVRNFNVFEGKILTS